MDGELELETGIAAEVEVEDEKDGTVTVEVIPSGSGSSGTGTPGEKVEGSQHSQTQIEGEKTPPRSQSQTHRSGKGGAGFQPPAPVKVVKLVCKPLLTRQDVTCPICWSILIEPTTLPCNHSLCHGCYQKQITETSLFCPCCRRRLSVWSRRAKKKNELIDQELWQIIKNEFAELVEARQNGMDSPTASPDPASRSDNLSQESNFSSIWGSSQVRDAVLNAPKGEIFKELQEILVPHENDIATQREKEEAASLDLIQKLQEEDVSLKPKVTPPSNLEGDYLLAHKLANEWAESPVPVKKTRLSSGIVKTRDLGNVVRNLGEEFDCLTPSEVGSPAESAKPKSRRGRPKGSLGKKKSETGSGDPQPGGSKKKKSAPATVTKLESEPNDEDAEAGDVLEDEEGSQAVPESEPDKGIPFSPFSIKLRIHTEDWIPDSAEKKPQQPVQSGSQEDTEVIIGDEEYIFLEKEANQLKSWQEKVAQEELDSQLAKALQSNYDYGILSPRVKNCENQYKLRNWEKKNE